MHTTQGFSKIILISAAAVMVVLAGALIINANRNNEATDQLGMPGTALPTPTPTPAEADIALYNVGLNSFDNISYTRFATTEFKTMGLKGFYVFGDKLGVNDSRINPNFEFAALKPAARAVAAIDGVITFIQNQPDSNDYEVMLQPKDGSLWIIGYDHLVDLKVKKGDVVKVGDVLGTPATQNNGIPRFEIQINKELNGTTHVCPSTLLHASVKDSVLASLKTTQDTWESTVGLELYNPAAQSPIGCLKTVLTPAQAEGK